MELVFPRKVAQLHFAALDRADAAEDVLEDLIGGVGLERAVAAPVGHVVGIVGQKDEVVALPHVQRLDDLLIEGGAGAGVLQGGGAQGGEEAVLVAVRHLLGGEDDVQQIAAQRAGEGLFQEAEVFFRLLFGHQGQRLVQVGDDLLAGAVDVTAVNPADGGLVQPEPAAQFRNFFLIHGGTSLYRFASYCN